MLVAPQRLRRARGRGRRAEAALGAELAALLGRVAADRHLAERVGALAAEVLQDAAVRVFEERRTRMEGAAPLLLEWGRDLLAALTGPGLDMDVSDARTGLRLARTLLGRLADAMESPAAPALRPHVAGLIDILQTRLAITPQDMLHEAWRAMATLADALEEGAPAESVAARGTRRELGRMLRRLVVRLQEERLPQLDADTVTTVLAGLLAEANAPRAAATLRCVADALGAFLDGSLALAELVRLEAFGEFRSLGAAAAAAASEDRYLWYASWLMGTDVVLDRERTEITAGGETIASGSDLTPADLPAYRPGEHPVYTFRRFDVETCETVAYVTAIVRDALQVLLHALSIEEGDVASNVLNLSFGSVLAVARGHAKRPFLPPWGEHIVFWLATLLGSIEGRHTRGATGQNLRMWLTLAGPDLGEMLWYRYLATRAREAILSGITLANHDRDSSGGAGANRTRIAGIADCACLLTSLVMVACYPKRRWGLVDLQGATDRPNWSLIVGWCIGGSIGMTLLGRILGGLGAGAIAGDLAPRAWLLDRKVALVEHLFAFNAMLYMVNDGRTNGGRYNPAGGDAFAGFPEHATSPYTLPYPRGRSCYVGQANQGLFSHNFLNGNQVYAYDFSLEQDAVILASRPGTVVDWMDTDPDDQNVNGGNFILIRHDRDDDLNAVAADATHDRGVGGTEGVTYALYLHGRQSSVREFFPGVPSPIGERVRRGQPIMRSGSTGISFHNHLHMDVRQEPAGFSYTDRDRVARGALSAPIPFVFRDVTNGLGRDGECSKLTWYTSSTEEVS